MGAQIAELGRKEKRGGDFEFDFSSLGKKVLSANNGYA
jgi:hypothetical protein